MTGGLAVSRLANRSGRRKRALGILCSSFPGLSLHFRDGRAAASGSVGGKNPRRGAHLRGGRARALSLAARQPRRAGGCAAQSGESRNVTTTRDARSSPTSSIATSTTPTSATSIANSARSIARRRTTITTSSRREQLDQKLDELTAIGGVQILMQGGHHPKLGIRLVSRPASHIREKYPHINIHGFSPPEFNHFAEVFGMPLREVIAQFQGGRARLDPRRRRRDPGRSRAATHRAAEMQDRPLARGDADRARARPELERDDDVRPRRDDRRPDRASCSVCATAGRDAAASPRSSAGRSSRSTPVLKAEHRDRRGGISAHAGAGPHLPR